MIWYYSSLGASRSLKLIFLASLPIAIKPRQAAARDTLEDRLASTHVLLTAFLLLTDALSYALNMLGVARAWTPAVQRDHMRIHDPLG